MQIQRQPDANTVATVDSIKATMPNLVAQLPGSVQALIRNDRSVSIRDAIHDVKLTLAITAVLVILVIYLFLRRPSATIIPAQNVKADGRTGSIKVGKEADLLLVDGDPEKNIGDLRHVDQVMSDGVLMDGDALRTEAGFSGKPK